MEALVRNADLYRESFEAFAQIRRWEPSWLRKIRRLAFERFQELGFPTTKLEAWKYTGVGAIAATSYRLAAEDRSGGLREVPRLPRAASRLVFVDGRHRPDLSTIAAEAAVRVSSLRQALADRPDSLQTHLARQADVSNHPFTAWNTAFLDDGALIEVPAGAVLGQPLELLFLSTGSSEPTVSHLRNLVLAGPHSQATLIERYTGNGAYLTNSVTEIVVGDGAVVNHYNMQREALPASHVHSLEVRQERASNFTSHNLMLGAALARTDIRVLFAGEGGECALNGLFVGSGSQHLDTHTLIDHAKPHCVSRELYKGILDGKARGVFHGTIIVRPGAQKTDAMQTNKNLLLSREALVDSTPALEIFADDVKCKHGSTIGQLDENALFYLHSRGIGSEEARAILTYAFAADVAGRIRIPALRTEIEELLGLAFGPLLDRETAS